MLPELVTVSFYQTTGLSYLPLCVWSHKKLARKEVTLRFSALFLSGLEFLSPLTKSPGKVSGRPPRALRVRCRAARYLRIQLAGYQLVLIIVYASTSSSCLFSGLKAGPKPRHQHASRAARPSLLAVHRARPAFRLDYGGLGRQHNDAIAVQQPYQA